MTKDNLHVVEYPRLMHSEDGTKRRVENVDEAERAVKDGFELHPTLTKDQEKALDKALTPEQKKADEVLKKAEVDAKQAEADAAEARAEAARVNTHQPTPAKKK